MGVVWAQLLVRLAAIDWSLERARKHLFNIATIRGNMRRVDLWLDPIPPELRQQAQEAFAAGSMVRFLGLASNEHGLSLVVMNARALKAIGAYEAALLGAFIHTRVNNRSWPLVQLRFLFEQSDRGRLRAAGDLLPAGEQFTLYRGVAGRGSARRVRGLSWTGSRERAEWFASRAAGWKLHDPAVYRAVVGREDIYAYVNERREEEYVVLLPRNSRLVRV